MSPDAGTYGRRGPFKRPAVHAGIFVFMDTKFILVTKERMTRFFTEDGSAFAATVLKTAPLTVTQVKTKETDGYNALQVAMGERSKKHVTKPEEGHFKKAGEKFFRHVREVRTDAPESAVLGDVVEASTLFRVGDIITVSGISKAKGFQGVVKRHGFSGGPRTHGQKHSEREPGSIGGGARAGGRVAKGIHMAGRTGGVRITVKNLKVLTVDGAAGEMLVLGAVPGRRGTLLEVRSA